MTREQWKERLPLIQAFVEGKKIEVKHDNYASPEWVTSHNLCFDRGIIDYRIKPQPKLRPWKPEEVPVGALLRDNDVLFGEAAIVSILAVRGAWIHYLDPHSAKLTDALCESFAKPNWEHSFDHGKTWLPCGVAE